MALVHDISTDTLVNRDHLQENFEDLDTRTVALETAAGSAVSDFTDLGDVPAAYTGNGAKVVAVKADESGLEFVDAPSDGADGADGAAGADGADGLGVPVGGTTGQVLVKASDDDFDTEWDEVPAGDADTLEGHDSAYHLDRANHTGTQAISTVTSLQTTLDAKADLEDGKVPSSQLPSFVDDVEEYADLASFPATGESGKLYIALDSGLVYRWTGSTYATTSSSLALGETSSTAYRGDRGKTAYDHSLLTSGNPHSVTKSDVGLGSVENYAVASQAEAEAGTASNKYMTPERTAQAITELATTNSASVTASEALSAGNLVNLWNDSGTIKARKADSGDTSKAANGYVLAAVSSGAAATVYINGINDQLSGKTPGAAFLSTSGTTSSAAATSGLSQSVGIFLNATTLLFVPAVAYEI